MERRAFVTSLSAFAATAMSRSEALRPASPQQHGTTVEEWRRHFPALQQEVNGAPLLYMDSAATTLRPNTVVDAIAGFYRGDNANPSATLHTLARRAHEKYEGARQTVADFINASDASEVVFTRGTTEALNLVAAAWGGVNLRPGDQILLGISEHASNMVPWQLVAKRTGAEVRYFGIDDVGRPIEEDLASKLTPRTRIVAFTHVSNVLGMVNQAKRMCGIARGPGRIVVVDAAQSVPHFPVDVRDIGCDFLALSGHKMLGPMGVGVLWGRRALLDEMPPYQGGSNMAHDVDLDALPLAEGALKFGAGTPNVSGPIGLAAAIGFMLGIGHAALRQQEQAVTRRMIERLSRIRGVRLLGTNRAEERIAVFAFTVEGTAPAAVARAMDRKGIAIRAGDLASLPLLKRLGTARAARSSCYIYTTLAEVDRFADALEVIAVERPT